MTQSYVHIRLRRDTSSNWGINNPILKVGEPGLETDTRKLKFGDGITAWNSLPYSGIDLNDSLVLESIDDRVATLIKAGSNISINYNDNANTLTIGATGLQLSGDYATLVNGKIPAIQLPSYVDDVLEFSNLAAFPNTGETGKIYVTLNDNKTYRWGGSTYVEISASPGSTDSVPEGSVNKYYTNARASAAAPVQSVAGQTGAVTLTKSDVGLGNVDNTSDANKPISSATQTALDLKAPLSNPTFTGTVSGITKSMVGLGNVDNTSDALKPLSNAAQSALNLKAPLANPTFTGTVSGITKSMVGLGNVDNTSDINKPVSTAQASADTAVQNAASSDATTKANNAQAYAIQRSNHTGTQLANTISDFTTAVNNIISTDIVAGSGVNITYDNINNDLIIGLNGVIPVIALGAVSGSTNINAGINNLYQTLTLNGSAVSFIKGTGWSTTGSQANDVILKITVTSATTISWFIVTEWFSQPSAGALSVGTHLFLLRGVGTSVIEGHYIGNKTN